MNFYNQKFESIDEFKIKLDKYINYYNNDRIKCRITTTRLTGSLLFGCKPLLPAASIGAYSFNSHCS